jgi:hypothetical protein
MGWICKTGENAGGIQDAGFSALNFIEGDFAASFADLKDTNLSGKKKRYCRTGVAF